ncbi:hypothetical protein PAPYR_6808 [Paratrimastix pyriformis]|uniref:Uncharacterized protein n=1 Tax=Paratrimastix pyriformis TaxID=342808 RepID=A0ABQ8UHK4_9EUKA|nr:hypothetical protein PAPYR_6808 [Paratrimastix pyriformis]
MRAIVEASPSPDLCYILMLSISHTWRVCIRGTLRELSFGEPPDPIFAPITSDALAALVGPCKALNKLTFPKWWANGGDSDWVDEAFGGHTQLAVLANIPPLVEPVAERLMSHLPGLVEFTASKDFDMSTRLLAALARSCPGLQVLRCPVSRTIPPDFAALGPLSGALKELEIRTGALPRSARESLSALVGGLTVVTSLKLPCCPPAALEPLASHLTDLELTNQLDMKDLSGTCLCRLETISLAPYNCPFPSVARLLSANQAALRSLSLSFRLTSAEVPTLMATLCALPRLASLDLVTFSPLAAHLPAELLDRLERFALAGVPPPPRLASSRLRALRLGQAPGLTLDCPALLDLDMTGTLTALHCPRLRTLTLDSQSLLTAADLTPMPDLEVATFRKTTELMEDPAWLLLPGSSPRLRELSGVWLSRPDLLAGLCACESLVRLDELHLDVTRLPNPLILRLPGQLECLDLHIGAMPGDILQLALEVEAPGLVDFALGLPGPSSVRLRLRGCPSLLGLDLHSSSSASDALVSVQVMDDDDEGAGGSAMTMQPRLLSFQAGLDAASLLGLLARHGSRLRDLTTIGHRMAADDWPRLMRALSGLPRLTRLTIDVAGVPSTMSLACPHLRRLDLHQIDRPGNRPNTNVVLDCPLLVALTRDGIHAEPK